MMGAIILLLTIGFLIGAVGIVKGMVLLGIIGFGLFVVTLIAGAVLVTR